MFNRELRITAPLRGKQVKDACSVASPTWVYSDWLVSVEWSVQFSSLLIYTEGIVRSSPRLVNTEIDKHWSSVSAMYIQLWLPLDLFDERNGIDLQKPLRWVPDNWNQYRGSPETKGFDSMVHSFPRWLVNLLDKYNSGHMRRAMDHQYHDTFSSVAPVLIDSDWKRNASIANTRCSTSVPCGQEIVTFQNGNFDENAR